MTSLTSEYSAFNTTTVETKENVRELAMSYLLYQIGEAINKAYFPILVPVGIIGNFLSFLVMIQPHNRSISFSLYISVLAVSDSVMLWLALFRYLNQVLDMDCPPNPTWHCRMVITTAYTAVNCSTLLIVSMTFDRFYSIIRPHKAAVFNTFKRAKFTIACIVMFSILFNLPQLYQTEAEGKSCIPNGKGRGSVYGQFYYWLSFILTFVFPFISLLTMNCVIINTLRQRSTNHLTRGHSKGQSQNERSTTRIKTSERQIYQILLLVTFSFLILSTPAIAFRLYSMFHNYRNSPQSFAGFYLYYNVAQKLNYTNTGINFFLYVMSGQKFRTDLINLFKCSKTNSIQKHALSISTISDSTGLE